MKIAFFSTKSYDREFFDRMNARSGHEIVYFESRLWHSTLPLVKGFDAVCVFVNDELDEEGIKTLVDQGVKLVVLRCAGFNNVDLCAAYHAGLTVARVPAYSPHGVAEHAVALLMALNRRIHRAYNRVREGNFTLEGLLGFEVRERTVGVVGTGRIGAAFAKIMRGFGSKVLAYDPAGNAELAAAGVSFLSLDEVLAQSDILSLHVPLMPETHHLIDVKALEGMKDGVVLINTSRGGLIDTNAVIQGLKSGKVGALGLDVYEEEAHLFFRDLSGGIIQDDVFARLLTFPNVIITGHQGFFTETALTNIAETTLENVSDFEKGALKPEREVTCEQIDQERSCGHPCGK